MLVVILNMMAWRYRSSLLVTDKSSNPPTLRRWSVPLGLSIWCPSCILPSSTSGKPYSVFTGLFFWGSSESCSSGAIPCFIQRAVLSTGILRRPNHLPVEDLPRPPPQSCIVEISNSNSVLLIKHIMATFVARESGCGIFAPTAGCNQETGAPNEDIVQNHLT